MLMLDVRRMKVLREVAQRGSFSAAAEALSFTQSAISQQVAALEREAGAVLVERSARGIRLTEAGEAVVRHADVILARLDEAEAELEAIAGMRGGRLRMASFESAGASIMPLAIAAFRGRHPLVELSLTIAENDVAIPRLRAGDLDLALVEGARDRPMDVEGIELVHLLDDPMYLALPIDHPLADSPRLELRDLADDAWIQGQQSAGCACNWLSLRACQAAGFEPRVAFESSDWTAVQGLVAAGVGVAIIAELGTSTVRDDIVIRDIGDQVGARSVYAAVTTGGYRSAANAEMVETLQTVSRRYSQRRKPLALAS
jgi:DNA-binding transcriptional LysR family regulator